jgi:ubiquinone/menaquinone biosynthesis C-methylase UbiE
MDMSNISGPKDEMFTHSITCMGVFAFPDPVKGVREIYRTLQVGGTAVVTTWKN